MSRIDKNTVLPLGWVVAGFAAGIGPLIAGVLWVQAVNYRLGRIEAKLGIPPLEVVKSHDLTVLQRANAAEKW